MNRSLQHSSFSLKRLTNVNNAAEGSNLPPRQYGDLRAPIVSNLRILKTDNYFGGTTFVLAWDEPEFPTTKISQFNIFATGVDGVQQPQGPWTTTKSPAVIRLTTKKVSNIVFTVQTQVTNGLVTPLDISPSVASSTIAPIIGSSSLGHSGVTAGTYGDATHVGQFTVDASGLVTAAANVGIVFSGQPVITPYVEKTAAYTLTANDYLVNCTSGTFDITLPTAVGRSGQQFQIKNTGTGVITIKTTSSQLLDNYTSGSLVLNQYEALWVASTGANWIIL